MRLQCGIEDSGLAGNDSASTLEIKGSCIFSKPSYQSTSNLETDTYLAMCLGSSVGRRCSRSIGAGSREQTRLGPSCVLRVTILARLQ